MKFCDSGAWVTEWLLTFRELNDTEAAALEDFFRTVEADLNASADGELRFHSGPPALVTSAEDR